MATAPIDIAVYDREAIEVLRATRFDDLAAITPGVNLTQQNNEGAPQTNLEIRGIASRTSAPTTGVYLGDTPLVTIGDNVNSGGANAYPVLFDLERVEILRGPQGTLYGSSSEGGAVRFITPEPSLSRTSVYARAEVAATEHGSASYEAGVAAGGPVVEDRVGIRFSAWARQDGGWIDRCLPALGRAGCAAVLQRNANSSRSEAFGVAMALAPVSWLKVSPSLFYQELRYNDPSGYEVAISDPSAPVWRSAHSTDLPAKDPLFIASLKLEAELPGVKATSVSSFLRRRLRFTTDFTDFQDFAFFGSPYPIVAGDFARGDYGIDQKDVTEEFRLSSNGPATARLNWVAGAFFSRAHQFDFAHVVHPDLPQLIQQFFGVFIEQVLGVPPYLGTWVAFDDVHTHSEQYALFGQADYKLTPRLTFIVGTRWAHYSSDIQSFLAGPFNGGEQRSNDRASGNAFTPKVGLSVTPDDRSLYYLTVAKGFRPGGANPQTTNATAACKAALEADRLSLSGTYQPDSLWSYEAGFKRRAWGDRLAIDASAFHIRWSGIQTAEQIAGCGFSAVFNLGAADANGFDFAVHARPSPSLSLDLAAAYTDAHFDQTIPGIVTKGDVVAGASPLNGQAVPPWSVAFAVTYRFRLLGREAYVWMQDAYHSANRGPFSSHNPANVVVYDPLLPTDPATNLVNAKLSIRQGGLEGSLFVDNLTDRRPQLSVFNVFYPDPRLTATTWRPRTWGARLTMRY